VEYLVPKPSGATVTYFTDWSNQLQAGDVITTFDLTVTSGTVTILTDPQPPLNFGVFIRFVVAGGTDGETAVLTNEIHTLGGQVLSREIQLAIIDTAEPLTPSTATKRALCNMAFRAMGLPGYEFDATPEEYAALLDELDAFMALWRTNNLDLNYNFPAVFGGGDLDDPLGIPDDAIKASSLQLAYSGAPAIGKTISTEARLAYGQAMNALRARYSVTPQRVLQKSTPRGAGQKPYGIWWPYGYSGSTGTGPNG
jgi:hypothetical protein